MGFTPSCSDACSPYDLHYCDACGCVESENHLPDAKSYHPRKDLFSFEVIIPYSTSKSILARFPAFAFHLPSSSFLNLEEGFICQEQALMFLERSDLSHNKKAYS